MIATAQHTAHQFGIFLLAIIFLPSLSTDLTSIRTISSIAATSPQTSRLKILSPTLIAAESGVPQRRKGGGSR